MLQIKLLDSKTPTESQELDLELETTINGECFIGRSSHCAIFLDSPEVSRVHGSICFEEGHYCFTDLASLGGSRLNDEVVKVNQKYLLQPNDIIRIGEFILVIKAVVSEGETTEIAAATPAPTPPTVRPIVIPPATQKPLLPTAPPREYMPLALVPPEQISSWTKDELTVRCLRITNETADVKTFCFVAEPPVRFTYKPGQFVTLNLQINGKSVKRSYSISSTPSRPHTLEITVKRVPPPPDVPDAPAGLVSNWLHDNLKVGTEIKVKGPSGKFNCFDNPAQQLLLISAGSGITPMMSMSRWVFDTAADCDIVFFHCARSPKDIIFRHELEMIAARNPKFRLAIATTRSEPGQAWFGFTGRLTETMLYAIAPDFWQRTVYVCGPNGFMQGVKTMMEGLGFPMQNYYEESFGGAKNSKPPSPLASPIPTSVAEPIEPIKGAVSLDSIRIAVPMLLSTPAPSPEVKSGGLAVAFAKSSQEVVSDGQDSILELAEQEGIEIDSSCRSGVCGTCKQRKLEGEVKYEGDPDALDESEQEEGYILPCIAYPVGRVVIDV
ncbi:MAG: FHA domain-containing protein [Kastovskya adunca ATA6-11-RM4]|jgi:ferredoxin-NADP reductase|nr:FHA domain-containing protein [Kastovskya adunca ATA6-11-RM4]